MTIIKWTSGAQGSFKTKEGKLIAKVPANQSIYEVCPELKDLPYARIKFDTIQSSNNRIVVAVETATGLLNYYAPLVPIANIKKDIWLPKDAEELPESKPEYQPEYIVGKTIKWGSRNAIKQGFVLAIIPAGENYMEVWPELKPMEEARTYTCGDFVSPYERILVAVLTKNSLVNYHTPVISKKNVKRGLYLPKQGEIVND